MVRSPFVALLRLLLATRRETLRASTLTRCGCITASFAGTFGVGHRSRPRALARSIVVPARVTDRYDTAPDARPRRDRGIRASLHRAHDSVLAHLAEDDQRTRLSSPAPLRAEHDVAMTARTHVPA